MTTLRALSVFFAFGLSSCALENTPPTHAPLSTAFNSWASRGASTKDLLYVSNSNNEVSFYDYSNRALVGVLVGFKEPWGLCSDRAGHVFITDAIAQKIIEYAHGGKKRMKTLDDAPDTPRECSVDPKTGDLAVANDDAPNQGNIAIWTQATGIPQRYTDSTVYTVIGCVYDSNGNLFADGTADGGYVDSFVWMAHNSNKLTRLQVPGPNSTWKWEYSDVGWDGRFYTIDNQDIYQIAVDHGQAHYIRRVLLGVGSATQSAVFGFYGVRGQATAAIGATYADYGSAVVIWSYPAGGDPKERITHGIDSPTGATISYVTAFPHSRRDRLVIPSEVQSAESREGR